MKDYNGLAIVGTRRKKKRFSRQLNRNFLRIKRGLGVIFPDGAISIKLALLICFLFLLSTLVFGLGALRPTQVSSDNIPSPLILGKYEQSQNERFTYTFNNYESLYRIAKYAIGKFCALIPSPKQIDRYIVEVVAVHNYNKPASEQLNINKPIPKGTSIDFFPPSGIKNENYEKLAPAYDTFRAVVDDKYTYITGLWAERGAGGSRDKHQGIDVASRLGAKIISPVEGIAYVKNISLGGRTVGVQTDDGILVFAHMNRRYVKSGQKVEKGQVLGTVGMTGRTSGPHVHIFYGIRFPSGVRYGRHRYKWTDPMLWYFRNQYFNS